MAAAGVGLTTQAQPRAIQSLEEDADAYPNFDIRLDKAKATAAQLDFLRRFASTPEAVTALADVQQAATDRLKGIGAIVEVHAALGAAELVSATPGAGFLTSASEDREAAMRGFMAANALAYGLTPAQVASLELVTDYANPAGNMAWVEFEQKFNGIPVFQGLVRGGFTAKGELARTTGVVATAVDESTLATSPSVGAAQAVALSAENVGWKLSESALVAKASESANAVTFERGSLAGEPSAWLVYFPLVKGVARLAWATQIIGDPYGFLSVMDAETGTVLFRKNLTNFQTQAATYNIYTDDSPAPSSPTPALPGANFQAPYIPRQSVTLIGNEAPNTFNNLGWMTDGTNETAGNNTRAGLDLVLPDGIEATVPGAARVFNFAYNPETDAPSTAAYRSGEVTDMFYWTNLYHDRLYNLGFTEPSRNFQVNNFGRGGLGADRINAEAQDNTCQSPPCFNNANFMTPVDGTSGRMQMYIFPGPTPGRPSTLDHDVLIHELTHGTSNRLHNNAAGLTTIMSGGMGEGWSDFYARALLATASENQNGVYPTAGWVTYLFSPISNYTNNYYYGIRRFPYAVMSSTGGPMNRPFNPLTFADIDPAQISLTDGAYPRGPIGSGTTFQVHNIGEVWASALNEVRARYITRLGFAVGNHRILQFVTDGMKLDPVNPTLLQGRNSIIAAANAGGGTAADIADIWAGFAFRGMGVSAQVINAGNGTVVQAFDQPGIAAAPTGLFAESIIGNTVTLRWTPPSSGLTPSGYVLEGGINPGEVLASIPTGSTAPTYTFVAPTGSFYVRMHTLSGANKSLASNEIRIHVNVPVPPSAPTNLLGLVNGSGIALAWKNTFAGGAPSTIVLDVTGSLTTTIPLGLTDTFQFGAVPPGTYTLSLRAVNGAGVSPSSNSLTLTFPGACSGVPQSPANFLTYKVGNTIFVTWDPPAAGFAPTLYVLSVTGSFTGAFATPGRALSGTVGPGTYNINVYAANACGNGPATPVQTVTVP